MAANGINIQAKEEVASLRESDYLLVASKDKTIFKKIKVKDFNKNLKEFPEEVTEGTLTPLYKEVEIDITKDSIERIWDGYELVEGEEGKVIGLEKIVISSELTENPIIVDNVYGGGAPKLQVVLGKTTFSGHIKTLFYESPGGLSKGALTGFEVTYYDESLEDDVVVVEYLEINTANLTITSDSSEAGSFGSLWIRLEEGEIVDYILSSRYVNFEVGDTITINNETITGQSEDIVFTVSELTDTLSPNHIVLSNQTAIPTRVSSIFVNQPDVLQGLPSNGLLYREGVNGLDLREGLSWLLDSDLQKVGTSLYLNISYGTGENDMGNAILTWRYFLNNLGELGISGKIKVKLWYNIY